MLIQIFNLSEEIEDLLAAAAGRGLAIQIFNFSEEIEDLLCLVYTVPN